MIPSSSHRAILLGLMEEIHTFPPAERQFSAGQESDEVCPGQMYPGLCVLEGEDYGILHSPQFRLKPEFREIAGRTIERLKLSGDLYRMPFSQDRRQLKGEDYLWMQQWGFIGLPLRKAIEDGQIAIGELEEKAIPSHVLALATAIELRDRAVKAGRLKEHFKKGRAYISLAS